MFLWRKFAEHNWLKKHEDRLQTHANGQLVIVRRPGRKRLELEIICRSRGDSTTLINKFGGRIEPLPRNWFERLARADSKPIRIGKRLIVVRSINKLRRCNVRRPQGSFQRSARADALGTAHPIAGHVKAALLVIPASLAFGTGDHATTAMSLRFLEQLTRGWKPGWSLVDLGTGSGIFALAAKRLGAGRVTAIDNDPTAIAVAKANARLNKIRRASFQSGDVHNWSSTEDIDVITANLYGDLLIEILTKLDRGRWLILSGILSSQKDGLVRALQQSHFDVVSVRRRGKWIALMARRAGTLQATGFGAASFCGGHRPPLQ